MKKVLFLWLFLLVTVASFAHGVQVAYTVMPNGFIRVYVEHWHGSQTTSSLVNNGMSITTTYGSTTVTQNLNPSGAVNNVGVNGLPVGSGGITILATCPGEANRYNTWAYYDFAPAAFGVQVLITLNSGNTVVLTEACSNLYPQTISATFIDNAPPTITCPTPTANVSCGSTGTNVNFVATATDNAGVASITYSKAPGSFFPVGTTMVTATATDINGFSSNCTFPVVVSVVDNQPPSISCPAGVNVPTCNGVVPNLIPDVITSDNCTPTSSIVVTQSPAAGTVVAPGTTINVTLTARDASNNAASCTTTVTSAPVQAPIITCPVDVTVNATSASGAAVTYEAPTVSSNCPFTTALIGGPASGSTFPIGTTAVTYKVTGFTGLTSTCTFNVTVTGLAPQIACPANVTVYTSGQCNAVAEFIATETTAIPASTISYSITSGSAFAIGTTEVTATATNAVGSSSCTFTVTVIDNEAPVLEGVPANTTVECDAVPAAATVTATDNCSTSAPSYAETRTNGICPSNYTLTRTWSTTDASGNTTSASQVITVQDTKAPVLSAAPANATVECSAVPPPATLTATDNCDAAPVVTYNQTSTQNANVNSTGHYNYTLTRTWTATDACGNASSKTQVIAVQDVTAPVASCKPVTITLVGGTASITASSVDNNSADNCSPVTLSVSKTTFTCANLGSNTVTLTVKDVSGNTSTCSAVVTVVGEIPTCSIASVPTSNVYTGGVPTNLYLGYGAQSTTLQVSAPASGAPYTYAWTGTGLNSTTSGAPVFTPTAPGSYTFTVKTTNKYGCFTTCTITICVRDVRVPGTDGKKIYVCHLPPGNPGNAQTLSISINAVPTHIGQHDGDRLGTCDMQPCGTAARSVEPSIVSIDKPAMEVIVAPNPSTTYFELVIKTKNTDPVNIKVMDANGKLVQSLSRVSANSYITVGSNYAAGIYFAEILQGNERKVVKLIKGK